MFCIKQHRKQIYQNVNIMLTPKGFQIGAYKKGCWNRHDPLVFRCPLLCDWVPPDRLPAGHRSGAEAVDVAGEGLQCRAHLHRQPGRGHLMGIHSTQVSLLQYSVGIFSFFGGGGSNKLVFFYFFFKNKPKLQENHIF